MRRPFSAAAALLATFGVASASTCYPGNPCPESTPCCSQYGQCGVGAYCLGGCDPQSSYNLESCMAVPTCQSENYKLSSLDDVQANTEYLGDASKANWVSSGQPVAYDDSILLTLTESSVGTLLTSTHYVWYGTICATMTTSQGKGVVTAFIMMSDVKDEIDWEFVGADVLMGQSNFYWQGVTDYTNSLNITTSNTRLDEHTYCFDWKPDEMSWSVDGVVGRTVYKNATFNSTDNQYHYPQTPARVQLSIWPAGSSSNAPGTINWAGGLIDWNSPYMSNGYYYAMVKEVTVDCYSSGTSTKRSANSAYYYTDRQGLDSDVAIGSNNTILGSFQASGNKPDYNPSGSASGSQPTSNSVPGVSGDGNEGLRGGSASSASSAAVATSSGFVQGNASTSEASTLLAGSAVALLAFVVAALLV